MEYPDIVEAILILIGHKTTQDVIDHVYYETVIRRVDFNGGFAATVAKAAGLRNGPRMALVKDAA